MSLPEVASILGRAVEDDHYRNLLLSGSSEALKGYELTESETTTLMGIGSDSYTSTLRGLIAMRKMMLDAGEFNPQ